MSILDEIKERIDIVELISGYIKLERAGKYYRALCPFHPERHPSFYVSPEKGIWRCFGCGAGGDVFSFTMRINGVSFKEALQILSERTGVRISKKEGRLYEINKLASRFYHDMLLNSEEGELARGYMRRRGISGEMVELFELGYSPKNLPVREYLLKKGFDEDEIRRAGLFGDIFKGRLIFPIRDIEGKVIGFGARALDDSEPKYINTPTTPIFEKGSVLYGIDIAKRHIKEKDEALIVEGYMDVITCHKFGIRNAVGSMGTSFTEKQALILKGLTKRITLALDSDKAGDSATLRSIELLRSSFRKERIWKSDDTVLDARIYIMRMPEGEDPDSLLRKDPERWKELKEKSLPLFEFAMERAKEYNLKEMEGKRKALSTLMPIIAEADEIEAEEYMKKASELLQMDREVLRRLLPKFRQTPSERGKFEIKEEISIGDAREEYILSNLIQNPWMKFEISEDIFDREENREILRYIRGEVKNPVSYTHLTLPTKA